MVVEVKMFGALRQFSENGVIVLELPDQSTVQQARDCLKDFLSSRFPGAAQIGLIDKSALANDRRVLKNEEVIGLQRNLALLPPVCGG